MHGLDVPRVVAHRGGRGPGRPSENTLEAFQYAYDRGARAIEIDVRPCATGEVVVMHDPTLARMTAGRDTRAVASIAWSELAHISLADDARAPSLDDVLAWARERDVVVNVEMKHDAPNRSALALATGRIVAASRASVVLSSFDPWLLACAAASSRAPRAILTYADEGVRGELLLAAAVRPAVDAGHVERTQASPDLIRRLRKRGLAVGVWTVNDAAEARDLLALGASYIITDRPEEISAAVAMP
jgi:glycerophosphoryl diester phosphodiesterase